ncbi:MAG: beta-lactamase family protein [Polyangiaceae bacterium]|nr:beta-lactamase family protein [Polyangiaceae bacterium]
MNNIRRALFFLLCTVMAAFLTGCAPRELELRPITGHTFSALHTPPDEPTYGPLDAQNDEQRFRILTSRWHDRLRARGVPGGAIAVVLDGKLRFSAGVGVRRVDQNAPVTATTRFRVASVSKMVVAATVLSLAESGRFELDGPLRAIVPDFSAPPRSEADIGAVTIASLMTHTAAIPDLACLDPTEPLDKSVRNWASWPFWGPPGKFHNYSNFGYTLLATAIERVEHEDFRDVIGRRIFIPAGMTTASYVVNERDGDVAAGHVAGRVIWEAPADCEASQAAGGVVASAVDFAHFAEVLLGGGGKLLTKTSVDAMLRGRVLIDEPPRRTYGFGIVEFERAGMRVLEHGGFAAGFATLVRLVPERGFAVIAFVNAAAPIPTAVADAAMSSFLGVRPEKPLRERPSPGTFGGYAGLWEDTAGALGKFVIVAKNDHLIVRAVGDDPLPRGLTGTFVLDSKGRAEYFVTRVGVARRVANRE